LAANYFGMTQGIHFSGPSNAAIIIQLAPVFLVIAGVVLFRETIRLRQLVGIIIAMSGFYLFYLDRVTLQMDGLYLRQLCGSFT